MIVKIPFRLKVMAFSNNCLFLFLLSWERDCGTGESLTLHHKQTISGEEMHTQIIHLWLVLWLQIQWMAYKLIYNPLIDYIRSDVHRA